MQESQNYISEISVRRRRRRIYALLGMLGVAICVLAAGANWVFISSPFFQIEKVDISGNTLISRSDAMTLLEAGIVSGAWWKSVLGLNNMLVWPDSLTRAGSAAFYPIVKNVTISKNYFKRTVSVTIEEREPIGVWCYENSGTCWWFDGEGVIFRRSPSAKGNLITVIRDYSQKGAGLNSKILPDQYVKNFLTIMEVMKKSKLGVKEIVIKDLALEEVEVRTRAEPGPAGPILYFSLRSPSESALAAIQYLYGKPGFKNLEYIDFRVENKAYFK